MNRDDLDRALEEYVDGRLPAPEREEIEKLLASDPKLAERVAFDRAVGAVLRTRVESPPGMGARARARFEKARPARRLGARFLSWEAAGLAAAVILLAFLFLPFPWRSRDVAPVAPSIPAPLEAPRPASAATSPSPAPAPSRPPAAEPQAAGIADVPREIPRPAKGERAAGKDAAAKMTLDASASGRRADIGSPSPRSRPLPPGEMPAGSFEVIGSTIGNVEVESRPGWLIETLAELQPDDRMELVVLVGPRPRSFSCAGSRLEVSKNGLHLLLPAAGEGRAAAPGGCAFVVPNGRIPVVVEDAEDERR